MYRRGWFLDRPQHRENRSVNAREEIMLLRLEQTERRYNSPLLPRSTNVVLIAGIYVRKVIQLRLEWNNDTGIYNIDDFMMAFLVGDEMTDSFFYDKKSVEI